MADRVEKEVREAEAAEVASLSSPAAALLTEERSKGRLLVSAGLFLMLVIEWERGGVDEVVGIKEEAAEKHAAPKRWAQELLVLRKLAE
jgi:hypothetical protein